MSKNPHLPEASGLVWHRASASRSDPSRWAALSHEAIEGAIAALERGRSAAAAAALERALDELLEVETDELSWLADAIGAVAEELVFVHALRDDEAAAARVLGRCRAALTSLGSDA